MIDKDRKKKIEKLEKTLNKTCQELLSLEMGSRRFTHLIHPYILVRVLPKETRTASGIYLPGSIQNKPIYEGIVLTTWKPYYEVRTKQAVLDNYVTGGVTETIKIYHESELKPGDHVLFPHHEGQPLKDILDEKYYRLIREGNDHNKWPYCSVYGQIDYEGHPEKAAKLRKACEDYFSMTSSGTQHKDAPNWQPPENASMFSS